MFRNLFVLVLFVVAMTFVVIVSPVLADYDLWCARGLHITTASVWTLDCKNGALMGTYRLPHDGSTIQLELWAISENDYQASSEGAEVIDNEVGLKFESEQFVSGYTYAWVYFTQHDEYYIAVYRISNAYWAILGVEDFRSLIAYEPALVSSPYTLTLPYSLQIEVFDVLD